MGTTTKRVTSASNWSMLLWTVDARSESVGDSEYMQADVEMERQVSMLTVIGSRK